MQTYFCKGDWGDVWVRNDDGTEGRPRLSARAIAQALNAEMRLTTAEAERDALRAQVATLRELVRSFMAAVGHAEWCDHEDENGVAYDECDCGLFGLINQANAALDATAPEVKP